MGRSLEEPGKTRLNMSLLYINIRRLIASLATLLLHMLFTLAGKKLSGGMSACRPFA